LRVFAPGCAPPHAAHALAAQLKFLWPATAFLALLAVGALAPTLAADIVLFGAIASVVTVTALLYLISQGIAPYNLLAR
jgi:hypothetical protein